jgi:hypothetical protein
MTALVYKAHFVGYFLRRVLPRRGIVLHSAGIHPRADDAPQTMPPRVLPYADETPRGRSPARNRAMLPGAAIDAA